MNRPKVGVILQVRMGSKRLPGKVLRKIGDKTIVQHILDRYFQSPLTYEIVLATSNLEKDNILAEFAQQNKIKLFRGDEQNVLSRYLQAAQENAFDHIIRLTGDNILTDYTELERLVSLHLNSSAEYSRSLGRLTSLPVGVGAEIFSYQTLVRLSSEAKELHHLEDVNGYIEDNPALFKISELEIPKIKKKPSLRLTVDTNEDLKNMRSIFKKNNNIWPKIEDLIDL